MPKKVTHETYLEDIKGFPIQPLERYVSARTEILHKCEICQHEWKKSPNKVRTAIKDGLSGCPNCRLKKNTKTNVEYIEELKDSIVKPAEVYAGINTKMLHRCSKCEYEWKVSPHGLRVRTRAGNSGCPNCAGNARRTHDDYVKEVSELPFEVLGEYINNNTPIEHMCKGCNYAWKVGPDKIKAGGGCPKCVKVRMSKRLRMTQKEYQKRLSEVRPDIVAMDQYKRRDLNLRHLCLKCSNEFLATPTVMIHTRGCDVSDGCIKCRDSKGGGFNPNKPGRLYYFKIQDSSGKWWYKLGITNNILNHRYSKEFLQRITLLMDQRFESGFVAREIEQSVHARNRGRYEQAPREELNMYGGITEFYPVDVVGIDK